MQTADEIDGDMSAAQPDDDQVGIQPTGFLLELSPDWIVLRASENVHRLVGESHVTLIDEPLGRFVHAQALHDLRNLFSRLSGTTGIARAYAVRLTDEPDLVDVAFQLKEGRVLLEAVPSAGCFGECFGSVAGLAAGLSNATGQALLDGGARRMRALTGYDRVTISCGEQSAESSRGAFSARPHLPEDVPPIVANSAAERVPIFPRHVEDSSSEHALMRSCSDAAVDVLRSGGVKASLRVPFSLDDASGEFCCESRTPRAPSFELHAAAELFAQLFAMRLELDALKRG